MYDYITSLDTYSKRIIKENDGSLNFVMQGQAEEVYKDLQRAYEYAAQNGKDKVANSIEQSIAEISQYIEDTSGHVYNELYFNSIIKDKNKLKTFNDL